MSTKRRKGGRASPPLRGDVYVPGDKSISHRALVAAACAEGTSKIRGLNLGADVLATARCLKSLGIGLAGLGEEKDVVVTSGGIRTLAEPDTVLDAGNSGTTMRILAGLCATIDGFSVLTGDTSLKARPMRRIADPLTAMGARLDGRKGGDLPPLAIRGGPLVGIHHRSPVASAQVKSCLLFAGLVAEGSTTIEEPHRSRDHSERILSSLGAQIRTVEGSVTVDGGAVLAPFEMEIPADLSAAAFLIAAALLVPGSNIRLRRVGLNPTRTGVLDVMRKMGAELEVHIETEVCGEPVGDILVRHSPLRGVHISGSEVVRALDEVPILSILAAFAQGETVIEDASELRVKESDRISTMVTGLRTLGVDAEERPDGMRIDGSAGLSGGRIDSEGDHRVAMSFAVGAMAAGADVRIAGWSSVDTSFPGFLDVLASARRRR